MLGISGKRPNGCGGCRRRKRRDCQYDLLQVRSDVLGLITDTSRKVSESVLEHLAEEAEDLETERVGDDTVKWTTSETK